MQNLGTIIEELLKNSHQVKVTGLGGSSTSLLFSRLMQKQENPLLFIVSSEERAEALATELETYSGREIIYFPGEPHLPYEEISYDFDAEQERLSILTDLINGFNWKAMVISLPAFCRKMISRTELRKRAELLKKGEFYDRQELIAKLVTCGYEQVTAVEDTGTFAVRGSIIDIFRPNDTYPVRLDLLGDELDRLFYFDQMNQHKVGECKELAIYPIREIILDNETKPRLLDNLIPLAEDFDIPTKKLTAMKTDISDGISFYGLEYFMPLLYPQLDTIWDYIHGYKPTLILAEETDLLTQIKELNEQAQNEYQSAKERFSPHLPPENHLLTPDETAALWQDYTPRIDLQQFAGPGYKGLTTYYEPLTSLKQELAARRINPSLGDQLEPLLNNLKKWKEKQQRILLTCATLSRADRLQQLLKARKLSVEITKQPVVKALEMIPAAGGIMICLAQTNEAFRCDYYTIIPDSLIFGLPAAATGRHKEKKENNRKQTAEEADLRNLREGDLVVHSDHGIGRYCGIKRLTIDGMVGDYVWLEYANGDKLYLPMFNLGLIHPYRGPAGAKLDELGGTRWPKAKQKVRQATQELASRLLALNAKRQTRQSPAFNGFEEAYSAFEARFPYDETPDQQKAIEAVLTDLKSPHPMDRLVCGDVGFGKTEVAIRASYRVVLNGYQVAILVPTTILAMQHGRTFTERLRDEPVRVEVLHRFRTTKEIKQVLADTKAGKVDILIGTHRLLSSDIQFKQLGLLVIDEEQRFGVRHKERLREIKAEVDTLTLTATPIPRTMYMSMVGLKDISIISTPPVERHAVKTIVTRYSSAILSEAITQELNRGGQVYVLYNEVATIEKMAEEIRMLVPAARVAVAHGQMEGNGLELVMADFINQVSNVLICSTIIENGLDIPSVNTIIVVRADMFGLSQLYQIRGRVGRGRQKASAYMLLPETGSVTAEARQRLSALQRYSKLGDGVSIAQEDLDIRGSGDLLGPEQSGSIAAVGFELYTELLSEAVEHLKGHTDNDVQPIEIKLPVTAHIPDNYISDICQRLSFYQRLSKAADNQELEQLVDQMGSMFGPLPEPVDNLIALFALQPQLRQLGAIALNGSTKEGHIFIYLQLTGNGLLTVDRLMTLCSAHPTEYRLTPSGRLVLHAEGLVETDADWINLTRELIQKLLHYIKG